MLPSATQQSMPSKAFVGDKSQEEGVCRIVRTTAGETYFLHVIWRGDEFDLEVTDVTHSWRKSGITAPEQYALGPDVWIQKAREALYQTESSTQFQYEVHPDGPEGRLEFKWLWPINQEDDAIGQCQLQADRDASAIIHNMLCILCTSYLRLQQSVDILHRANTQLKDELQHYQDTVSQMTDQREAREQQLFMKFALLLNAKKVKLKELRDELDKAEAKQQVLTAGGPTEEADHVDTEDEALMDLYARETDVESEGEGPGGTGPSLATAALPPSLAHTYVTQYPSGTLATASLVRRLDDEFPAYPPVADIGNELPEGPEVKEGGGGGGTGPQESVVAGSLDMDAPTQEVSEDALATAREGLKSRNDATEAGPSPGVEAPQACVAPHKGDALDEVQLPPLAPAAARMTDNVARRGDVTMAEVGQEDAPSPLPSIMPAVQIRAKRRPRR